MDYNTIGEYSLGFAGGIGIVVLVGGIIAAIVYAIYVNRNYGEEGPLIIIMGIGILILALVGGSIYLENLDVFLEKVRSVSG